MREETLINVENTINTLCNWICENAKGCNAMTETCVLPDMVEALAELISANASVMG